MTLDDLTVPLSTDSQEQLLSDWSWLIQDARLPILLSASGDAFLQNPDDGSIYFLDSGGANLEQVAESVDEFQQLLSEKDFVVQYLAVQMVGDLIQSGKTLEKGQVYSLVKPYILGGEYTLENIAPTDIAVHFSLLGQIHQQVKDLPDGTVVGDVNVEQCKIKREQSVCDRIGVEPQKPETGTKLGIALSTIGKQPINGLRHREENGTNGWYVWCGGEIPNEDDFFAPLHVEHIAEYLPEVIEYLDLPLGYRFQIDSNGYEDVWYEQELCQD